MPENQTTELVFILDKSGSMHGLEKDTIGGFNAMLDKQKQEEGLAYVTTILFDNRMQTLHDRIKLQTVPNLTEKDYQVGGSTALLDAVGNTIEHISNIHKYARPEDVPAHTIFIITTDGHENASRQFGYSDIKKQIEQKKELGWEFIFLGANIDAVTEGAKMGISAERSVGYVSDSIGTNVLYESISDPLSAMRRNEKINKSWRKRLDDDKKKRG